MKGITPVIASILLVMITVSMVGFAYFWLNDVTQMALNSTETVVRNDIDKNEQHMRIDNIIGASTTITIRNVGRQTIDSTKIILYVNSAPANGGLWVPAMIPPGETSSRIWIAPACPAGTTVKVTGPANSDQTTC